MGLERFCASPDNCFKVSGIGEPGEEILKVDVVEIGKVDSSRDNINPSGRTTRAGPVIRTYENVVVSLCDNMLTKEEVYQIIDLLYHPDESYLKRREESK